ncbi:MAG: hypothetical protein MMC33_005681 [Icmadophila ericetorum]|nr:hypothetical protein [Icmadophila ericetorum]
MAAIPRVGSSLGRLSVRSSPSSSYVCLHCRRRGALPYHQTSTLSTSVSRKAADKSFTGRLRRGIWGTDTPPGAEDPYTQRPSPEPVEDSNAALLGTKKPKPIDQVGYEPAVTWDGLEHIGGASGWWEADWDRDHQFTGFMAPTISDSKEEVAKAIRRALIEIYTLKEEGRPFIDAAYALDDKIIPNFGRVSFSISEDGSVSISFPDEETHRAVLQSVVKSEPVEEVLEVPEEAAQVEAPHAESTTTEDLELASASKLDEPTVQISEVSEPVADDSWISVSFTDPALKFAIFKRVMQLTGRRISDPEISKIDTAKDLLLHLTKKPKPKKLAEQLLKKEDLLAIPSVKIRERRFTPIDREKEVGRWKVIEKELEKRGLPVTGIS